MGDVLSLCAYRSGVHVDGTTLVWRGMRHDLAGQHALDFAEGLLIADQTGKSGTAAGFRLWADERCIYCAGWDMGPMTLLRGDETKRLAIRLLAAERARRGAEGPVSA